MFFWKSIISISLIFVSSFFAFAYSYSHHITLLKALRNAALAAAAAVILIILAFGRF